MGIAEHKCEVCDDNYSKYKCPKCLVRYCSLGCYKSHKENKCQTKETVTKSPVKIVSSENPAGHQIIDEMVDEDRLSEEQLQEVWNSDDIQFMIKNKVLSFF